MDIERDMELKKLLESIFIKNSDVNLSQPNVIAAVITAASNMASVSDITNSSETLMSDIVRTEGLELYGKTDDEMVNRLIGMGPQYVKPVIGYSVDFMDWNSARLNYENQKAEYDQLYTGMMERYKSHEVEKGRNL